MPDTKKTETIPMPNGFKFSIRMNEEERQELMAIRRMEAEISSRRNELGKAWKKYPLANEALLLAGYAGRTSAEVLDQQNSWLISCHPELLPKQKAEKAPDGPINPPKQYITPISIDGRTMNLIFNSKIFSDTEKRAIFMQAYPSIKINVEKDGGE